jgi:MYXO-CTERM domain-containing protein
MLLSGLASAAGRVEWKSKKLTERDDDSWRVEVTIYLPSPPDTPHLPAKFEFLPTVYYERSMMDGDKLVERKVPLEGRQALIESVDIGFMDPGSGKVEKRTRFSFKVTRAHGYEAGEYKVTIRDGRNGQMIGAPVTLIFDGENETIDRRAMVFTAEKKKKKEGDPKQGDAKEGDAKEGAGSEGGEGENSEAASAEGGGAGEGAAAGEGGDDDNPGEIKEKPGGCGCRVAERDRPLEALGLLALLGLALLRRRS